MWRNRGLALKLVLLILTSITIIFAAVFSYNYFFSRRIITANIEKNAGTLAMAIVNRIDTVLQTVEKVTESLAHYLETIPNDEAGLKALIRSSVQNNPDIYGSCVAYEPFGFSREKEHFGPYVFRSEGELAFTYIPYDYFTWDWYRIPKELGKPVWAEPYFDEGAGNIIMATYSAPFFSAEGGKGDFKGVVTADISLSWLRDLVSSIRVGQTGYGFLISKSGTFITHPDSKLVMSETIFSLAEARGDEAMRELGRNMVQGRSGYAPFQSIMTGKDCWLVYAPLFSNGWSLGVLFPREELLADITRLNHTVLILSLVGFVLILAVIVWIAHTIARPLRALSKTAEEIATGNLDIEIPPARTRDEVGRLSDSFDHMRDSLKDYIRELTETTAIKERIQSELNIASDIQMGLLPKTFPAFPDRREFDIYAFLEPAKEVGGDLYDFFFIDDERFCFSVGDVSGKGVPAALFMVITRTLIKTKAVPGVAPGEVLARVNRDLCRENPSLMFVTLFFGILNVRTGELEYCSGGHNLPYLMSAGGGIVEVEKTEGMALGIVEDTVFESRKLALQKGDTIFIYTDGITEATNHENEGFTEARLKHALHQLQEQPIQDVVAGVMGETKAFVEGAAQSDDITMMILRFFGGDGHG
ncbi:MAG: SpoIIE family protein phosphatase [Deltaproteobacteria bacterium]|nr:SpoIIE family protein phosphatase [Deltaproteobacteria bacterium]